jgi:CheY-like chemotaxis protein
MVQIDKPSKTDLSATAVAEVVHELRAPLGGIEVMARLLAGTDLSPEQDKLVRGLMAAAAHLRAVADDMLDDVASSRSGQAINDDCFQLQHLVSSIAISAESRAKSKSLAFATVLDEQLSDHFLGDAKRIRQMLENLLDNAIKVTESGSITLRVQQVDRRGNFEGVKFTVSDTGPGFGSEDRSKLFKSFSRLPNGVHGTGLGLSLVRRLARAMGGEAGCDAVLGKGADFWFTLRLKTLAAAQEAVAQAADAGAHVQPDPGAGRILIVDDNAANRMVMTAILEHFGYQTAEADSGETALELLRSEGFSAVMLDQTLPGMSGVETLRAIRAMPGPLATIPVVPVTGRVTSADRLAFAQAGANGFVEKPVTARAVRDALQATRGIQPLNQQSAA